MSLTSTSHVASTTLPVENHRRGGAVVCKPCSTGVSPSAERRSTRTNPGATEKCAGWFSLHWTSSLINLGSKKEFC